MRTLSLGLAIVAALLVVGGAARAADSRPGSVDARTGGSAVPLVAGEVTKIDKPAAKLTIRQGPIPNVDMPAMTMTFRVKDPAALEGLKNGDHIRFSAEKVDGNVLVTRVEPAR
jgi:Cu/Ag efflux protein CusF